MRQPITGEYHLPDVEEVAVVRDFRRAARGGGHRAAVRWGERVLFLATALLFFAGWVRAERAHHRATHTQCQSR